MKRKKLKYELEENEDEEYDELADDEDDGPETKINISW